MEAEKVNQKAIWEKIDKNAENISALERVVTAVDTKLDTAIDAIARLAENQAERSRTDWKTIIGLVISLGGLIITGFGLMITIILIVGGLAINPMIEKIERNTLDIGGNRSLIHAVDRDLDTLMERERRDREDITEMQELHPRTQ